MLYLLTHWPEVHRAAGALLAVGATLAYLGWLGLNERTP